MRYIASMENRVPQWLTRAVDMEGGDILCQTEVFQAPDGTWAAWVWKDDDKPVLNLPSRSVAEQVVAALRDAYRAGTKGDYTY